MALSHHAETWRDCLPRVQTRFPYVRASRAPSLLDDREAFVKYLARTHHLTLNEAKEEVDDFLYIEGLRRELND